jgi:GABA(A) receptor-associated protein
MSFKETVSFDRRKFECEKIKGYWPDKVPIIAEKTKVSKLMDIPKSKLLCPGDITVNQFQAILRNKLSLKSNESLFIFINSQEFLKQDETMMAVYERNKDSDGFLYMNYGEIEVLG